jgi:Fe-Mn family superoxide dismutase
MKTRREFLQTAALTAGALTLARASSFAASSPGGGAAPAGNATSKAPQGPFTLPPLPYGYDALEPHFDAQTMQLHHDKHHASYVAKLNEAVAVHPAIGKYSVESLLQHLNDLPETVRTAVRNQGGGHYNHSLWWPMLAPAGQSGPEPQGDLRRALYKKFESLEGFKKAFTDAATKHFGSGWAWLVVNKDKTLAIETTPNQDSPITQSKTPLLSVDVWEHAYYLKYQNRRPEYLQAFWNVVNWKHVQERYQEAVDGRKV